MLVRDKSFVWESDDIMLCIGGNYLRNTAVPEKDFKYCSVPSAEGGHKGAMASFAHQIESTEARIEMVT